MKAFVFALVALVCVPAFAAQKQVIVQKNVQRNGVFRRNVQVDVQKVRVAPVRQQVVVQRVVAHQPVQQIVVQRQQVYAQPLVQQIHAGYVQPLFLQQQVYSQPIVQQQNAGCNLLSK